MSCRALGGRSRNSRHVVAEFAQVLRAEHSDQFRITGSRAMKLAVVQAAERNGEFVADLAPERPGNQLVEMRRYCRACIHLQASLICVAKSECFGCQPSSARARPASPIRTGGSPGRRAAVSCGTAQSHTFSAAAMTSLTENPRALARLSAPLSPPLSRCSSAFTC